MRIICLFGVLALCGQTRDRNFEREGEGERRRDLNAMEGKPAPEIEVERWLKGEPAALKDLRGKVVLLEFWSIACGPCRGAVRQLKELHEKYQGKDLAILAIHAPRAAEEVLDFLKEQQISYRVALDKKEGTSARYKSDSCPDYYLVDRKGLLRFADLANREVERAVEFLLVEK